MRSKPNSARLPIAFIHASVDDLVLPAKALQIFLRLQRRAGSRGTTVQSINGLADQLNMSRGTVRKSLDQLIEIGLIARTIEPKKAGGSVSKYRVLDREEWLGQDPDVSKNDLSEPIPTGQILDADVSKNDLSLEEKSNTRSNTRSKVPTPSKTSEFRPTDPLPIEWQTNEDLLEAWDAWVESRWNRWKGKVSWAARAGKTASKRLMTDRNLEEAIDFLEDAASAGWQGLRVADEKKGFDNRGRNGVPQSGRGSEDFSKLVE